MSIRLERKANFVNDLGKLCKNAKLPLVHTDVTKYLPIPLCVSRVLLFIYRKLRRPTTAASHEEHLCRQYCTIRTFVLKNDILMHYKKLVKEKLFYLLNFGFMFYINKIILYLNYKIKNKIIIIS